MNETGPTISVEAGRVPKVERVDGQDYIVGTYSADPNTSEFETFEAYPKPELVGASASEKVKIEAEFQAVLDASDAALASPYLEGFDDFIPSSLEDFGRPIADYDDSYIVIETAKQERLEQDEELRADVLAKEIEASELARGSFFDPVKIWNEKQHYLDVKSRENPEGKPPITNRGVLTTSCPTTENSGKDELFLSSSHNQSDDSNRKLIESKFLQSLAGSTIPLNLDSSKSIDSLNSSNSLNSVDSVDSVDSLNEEGLVVGCHWLEGVTYASRFQVLNGLSQLLDLPLGFDGWEAFPYSDHNGYTKMFKYGDDFKVSYNPDRKDQGVFISITGAGCEQVGDLALAKVYFEFFTGKHTVSSPDHVTRLDLAVDYCPFTVEQIRIEWKKDNVRTKVQYSKEAMKGREGFRNGHFHESAEGDTFDMGSKRSLQHACCYNRRGYTRFELRSRSHLAQGRAASYFAAVAGVDVSTGEIQQSSPLNVAIGFVREFVDFVDVESATERQRYNRNLCELLPFWKGFVNSVERLKVPVKEKVESTVAKTSAYVENNASNFYLYVMGKYHSAMEMQEAIPSLLKLCQEYLKRGLDNCKSKHHSMLRSMGFDPDDPALNPMGFL